MYKKINTIERFEAMDKLNISLDLRTRCNEAPASPGIYIFWDENSRALYIGKSINLRQRLLSHLYSIKSSNKELRILKLTKQITWQETAGELGALLKEAKLIKEMFPLFNVRLRKTKKLFTYTLIKSYKYLSIKIKPIILADAIDTEAMYGLFKNKFSALEKLREIIKANQLCDYTITGFKNNRGCFSYQLKKCSGACVGAEDPDSYNNRLQKILNSINFKTWPYKSAIAVKEVNESNGLSEYHFIDKWVYLSTETYYDNYKMPQITTALDNDYYKIILDFLMNKFNHKKVIEL